MNFKNFLNEVINLKQGQRYEIGIESELKDVYNQKVPSAIYKVNFISQDIIDLMSDYNEYRIHLVDLEKEIKLNYIWRTYEL